MSDRSNQNFLRTVTKALQSTFFFKFYVYSSNQISFNCYSVKFRFSAESEISYILCPGIWGLRCCTFSQGFLIFKCETTITFFFSPMFSVFSIFPFRCWKVHQLKWSYVPMYVFCLLCSLKIWQWYLSPNR